MSIIKDISSIIKQKIVEKELTDITAEQLDILLNQAFDSIPFLSTANKLRNVYASIQDMLLMDKVNAFLNEFSNVSSEDRIKFSDKMESDPVYGQKTGEFIISAVDRLDFKFKSKLLARICKFYAYEHISKNELVQMKTVLENMLVTELESILEKGSAFSPDIFSSFDYMYVSNGLAIERNSIEKARAGMEYATRSNAGLNSVKKIKASVFGRKFFAVISDEEKYFLDDEVQVY